MGGSLVLPWSESIRYAVKKNGYHGGVCRQEMLVPIGIWTAGHSPETDGVAYQAAYPEAPTWWNRSEEHTSELQSLMRISYAVFCLKKKKGTKRYTTPMKADV